MRKNGLTLVLAFLLCFALVFAVGSEAQAGVDITYVNTHSASGWYLWSAGVTSLVNAEVSEDVMNVTLGEVGGAREGFEMLLLGEVAVSNTNNLDVPDAMEGRGDFEGLAAPDLRGLFLCAATPNVLAVREDADIESFEDLDGKQINPGGMGTVTEDISMRAMEALGIEPEWERAGMDDAVDMIRDGRIDGFFKTAAAPDAADPVVEELEAAVGMNVVGMTEEQAEILEEEGIALTFTVPPNVYDGQDEPVISKGTAYGVITREDNLPAGGAYAFAQVGFGRQDDLAEVTPGPPMEDVIEATFETTPYPLHAEVVHYLEDHGFDVPEDLIPPEYPVDYEIPELEGVEPTF